jgi:hypothetical protein
VLCTASWSFGLTLPTAVANNGAGGIWMNLTSTNNTTLLVTSFQVYFQNATVGTAASVQVYRRAGTYVGFTANNTGWTLQETIAAASGGQTTLVTLNLNTPITIPAGQTVAVYLQCTTTGNGIRYFGTTAAPPTTTWTNADMTLFSDSAKASAVAFGTPNTPRTFAGIVNYIRDPSATGACCRLDGTCTFGAPTDCDSPAPAGVWRGTGSTCGTVTCQQPGACCAPQNAVCTMLAQFACLAPNTFTAENTTCSPTNPCPAGACCKKDGSCTSVTQTWCQTSGGIYTADGTACAGAGCPQPGACCLPNGGCSRLVEADCTGLGGTFSAPGVLCAAGNCWTAPILYHNGGIITQTGVGAGGYDVAQLATGGNALGVGFGGTIRLGAEFTIPAGQAWDINKFYTLGYQTFSPAPTVPPAPANPYTSLRVRILDRDPRTPGAIVLWGDTTTNVLDLTNSAFAGIFRVQGTLTDTARPLFKLIADVPNLNLSPGTYWIEYSGTNGASPFVPPVATQFGVPFGNAIQFINGNYNGVFDSTYQSATFINNPGGYPYNIPFVLEGAVGTFTGVCCQDNGGCFAATAGNCATGVLVANGSCAPNACPQPQVGVCCQSDGSCVVATPGIPAASCGSGNLVVNGSCTPNACVQPQVGTCCLPDGSCGIANPGDPLGTNTATCTTGTLTVNGTCTPNTCPPPAAGVCCRGASCSTSFADQAACLAAAPALQPGASHAFVTSSSTCNSGSSTTPCCYANYNHNATLEVQDIFDFLNDWFAGKKIAIPGGDGDTGALAVQNIFDFLNSWFAGGCV